MSTSTSKSSNTRVTLSSLAERMTAAEQVGKENSKALARIESLLTAKVTTTKATPTAAKASKGKKAKATTTGLTFKQQQAALKGLKAEGKAPAGMTVKQAVEAGLLSATATPEAKPATVKATKARKASTKTETGTPFPVLKAALKAHKASGAIPAQHNGTYVSVRSAIADGLMNADGTLPGTKAKATKKAKGAQVVATVTDEAEAVLQPYDAPRRANGTITPKREWALREQLAETGRYDRFQIDKKVKKALKQGLI